MKKILRILITIIITSVFLFPKNASAKTQSDEVGGIRITRNAPDSANHGKKIWINLVFENISPTAKTLTLKENLGNAQFDQNGAKYVQTEYGERHWYYEWKIQLPPGENTIISYYLIPENPGSYTISPSLVTIDKEDFYLKSYNVWVKCIADGKCDISSGENYLTCSADCKSGSSDKICDFAKDERCDPDCEKEVDPDCLKTQDDSNNKPIILPLILLIFLILFLLIYVKFVKKTQNKKPKQDKVGLMKTKKNNIIRQNIIFIWIGSGTLVLLTIPFLLMKFGIPLCDPGSGYEVISWTAADFVVMGILYFGAGSLFVLTARKVQKRTHRIMLALAFLFGFLWLWEELAIGIFTNWGS